MMRLKAWTIWGVSTVCLAAVLGYQLFVSVAKDNLLIGEATHGHHQIELVCEACHVDSFGGPEVLQDACTNCHQDELDMAHDSHPRKKLTDPRNAELAELLDAKQCITCHTEHQLEQTRDMGVTIPNDFCFHCHQDVGKHRESHKDLSFDSCASAGCHNFHDNRALYESFLVKNAGMPWVNYKAVLSKANSAKYIAKDTADKLAKAAAQTNDQAPAAHAMMSTHPDITAHWSESAHAQSQVGCASCHESSGNEWQEKPGIEACASCHTDEVTGFVGGKHGMRLSDKLPVKLEPMSPKMARLEFDDQASQALLTCNSCHDVHKPQLQKAAVESCLGCHADQHSLAYQGSAHQRLWQAEIDGHGPEGSGVSCASCHMPSEEHKSFVNREDKIKKVSIQHNQNATLRPNEKMIRPVCMQCHSLEFSIDALADEALILNNFNGKPSKHIESVDWALKRENR